MPQRVDELNQHQLIGLRNMSPKALIGRDGQTVQPGQFDPRRAECRLLLDDGLSLKLVMIAGAGISVNSLWSVHRELRDGSLVRVLPDYESDDQPALWLIYPQANVLTLKVRTFMDLLLDKIGKNPAWSAP